MNEQQAIKLCLVHHDPRGFEFLFKKYRREAYFHAVSLLGNREDAVDACQESFTRAYQAIPGLQQLTAFYPWFYSILRNCCLNMLSRRHTLYRHSAGEHREVEEEGTDANLPDVLMEQREEQTAVWGALGMLKPGFREILLMKYMEGASYEQISERLAIPRGTVMSRLYHARKAFRDTYTR